MKTKFAPRFKNEKLAAHWQVDETEETFKKLLYHLEVRSNFKAYFEEAMRHLDLDDARFGDGIVVADIGAGVGWTSAMIAGHRKVRAVYAVDPSDNRLERARFVAGHFGVADKVKPVNGTFTKPNVPEKVDIVLLCASLHHCYDDQVPALFSNVKQLLKPGGRVLVANEHYVDWLWTARKAVSFFRHLADTNRYYGLLTLRRPEPFGGEHWRTRKEVECILRQNGFDAVFYLHKGDLCKDKPTAYYRMGWHYYHAIASPK